MKIAHVINYFIWESALITSSIILFYSYYADICKNSNFRNFSRKFDFELRYLENGLADFSDTYINLQYFYCSFIRDQLVKPLQLTFKN